MTNYPPARPRSHTGVVVVVIIVVVVLVGLGFLLFGVPGSAFSGLARNASPTPTVTATPSPAPTSLDGTYIVDAANTSAQLPVADDPTDNPDTYAFYDVDAATVTVQGTVVTLTLEQLCLTYFEDTVCVDQVPLTWTGTLQGNTAVVQDAAHPISWATVTIADAQATLSRPNDPLCLLPDGSTSGAGDIIGDIHFYCGK